MSPPHGAGVCLGGGFVNGCVSVCLSYREAECRQDGCDGGECDVDDD